MTGPRVPVGFRPLTAADLPTVHDWLGRKHVARWWGERRGYEQTVEEYLPAIEGREPTDLYSILADRRAVGMIQTYLVAEYPDYAALVNVGENVAGLDLFIGEADLLGRGLGAEVIRAFADEIVFARDTTRACVADPDIDNVASIRSFEKVGFMRVRDFHDPDDGRPHTLMRLERGSGAIG